MKMSCLLAGQKTGQNFLYPARKLKPMLPWFEPNQGEGSAKKKDSIRGLDGYLEVKSLFIDKG